MEYKSPEDYLTINDFYKVYGYCCFYQSDTEHVCEISPEELTITFICNHYPRNLIQHLEKVRKLQIKKEIGCRKKTGNREENIMDNIIFIGMPAVGKSSVGIVVAKRLGYRFVDTDLLIQEQEGKLLKEIIAEVGNEGIFKN